MELIIKPTGKCNFNCSFCSSNRIVTNEDTKHVHEKLLWLIDQIKPSRLLINGGDPLIMDPDWYYEMYEKTEIPMSLTSNMKDFYLHPDKWSSLLNEEWMTIGTSFQYGNGRMWDPNTIYDEAMFIKVVEKFHKYIHHGTLPFIAVIDEHNEQFAMDHVMLAKKLDTTVKMNNAIPVGKCDKWYPRYKMFQMYISVIESGLEKYEANCSGRFYPSCPRNTFFQCNKCIRSCYVDINDQLHVSNCDEFLVQGIEYSTIGEITGKDVPDKIRPSEYIKEECLSCSLCRLCNGCNLNRKYAKTDPKYCDEMKKLEDKICLHRWIL